MIEFNGVSPARYERIHAAAEKAGIGLPLGGGEAQVAFHGVSGTSQYKRQPGEEVGTLQLQVTHVPTLFGVQLITPVAAEDQVRQFIEQVA